MIGDILDPSGDCKGAFVCAGKSVGKLSDGGRCDVVRGGGTIGMDGDGGLGIVPSDDTGESEWATDEGLYGDFAGDSPLFDIGDPNPELDADDGDPIFDPGDDNMGESDEIIECTGVGESRLITRGLLELVFDGAGCGVLGSSSSSSLLQVRSITSILGFFSGEAALGSEVAGRVFFMTGLDITCVSFFWLSLHQLPS